MTFRFKENTVNSNGYTHFYLYEFKEFMKLASPVGPGWTVVSSSNGTTYGVGDNFTSPSVTGIIWFVLQSPTGNKQIMIYANANSYYKIKYSYSAGFTGGTATVPPTATDEGIILSNKTDTTGNNYWFTNNKGIIMQIGADDSNNYSFFMVFYNQDYKSGISSKGCLYMDELDTSIYNDLSEIDPVVFYVGIYNDNSCLYNSINNSSIVYNESRCSSWCFKGSTKESFTTTSGLYHKNSVYGGDVIVPRKTPHNLNGDIYLIPIIYSSVSFCLKGVGKNFKFISNKAEYDYSGVYCLKQNNNCDSLVVGDIVFPWSGNFIL
jgi:hypothetical protein